MTDQRLAYFLKCFLRVADLPLFDLCGKRY